MKTACVLVIIALILSATCDPTKAMSVRVKRQWSWDQEGTPRPGPRPTPRPRPTPGPQTSSTSTSSTLPSTTDQFRDCLKNCPTTSQYNPICGTNGVTYDNDGKLGCARSCGIRDLEIGFRGTCAAL